MKAVEVGRDPGQGLLGHDEAGLCRYRDVDPEFGGAQVKFGVERTRRQRVSQLVELIGQCGAEVAIEMGQIRFGPAAPAALGSQSKTGPHLRQRRPQ